MGRDFFTENSGLLFHFQQMDIDEAIWMRESMKEGDYIGAVKKNYQAKLSELGILCAETIAPAAHLADRESITLDHGGVELPEVIRRNLELLKQAGVNGVVLPTRYGGLNFPVTVYAMMIEMVARADASLQTFFGLQSIAETILDFGTPEQKWELLPGFASGELDGAMVLTEPGAGSDLQSVMMTAEQDADGCWRLNGIKQYITNGGAQVLLVLARSEEGTRDGRGLSLFLVRRCPEVQVIRLENKLGIHGSPTCELRFKDAPAELIGDRRFGLIRCAMSMMTNARLSIGAQAVGLMEAVRTRAWEYCRERQQFGKPLALMPPVEEMLSRMDVLTAGCRALLYETSKWVDMRNVWNMAAQNDPDDKQAPVRAREFGKLADVLTPILKFAAAEAANVCAYDGLQCLGGRGYMREYEMERLYRDARILSIYEGTSQMQVVAATAGILKGDLKLELAILTHAPFESCAEPLLIQVKEAYASLENAQEQLPAAQVERLSRHLVKGYAMVLMALLLLKQAGHREEGLQLARRFCSEYLPQIDLAVTYLRNGTVKTE